MARRLIEHRIDREGSHLRGTVWCDPAIFENDALATASLRDAFELVHLHMRDIARISKEPAEVGQVKWFDDVRGYGFLVAQDGAEVFVHRDYIVGGPTYRTLRKRQYVLFRRRQGSRSLEALDVQPIA